MRRRTCEGSVSLCVTDAAILAGVTLAAVIGTSVGAMAQALKDVQTADTPLVLKAQGSFFVGGEKVEQTQGELGDLGPGGHIAVNQMYVRVHGAAGRRRQRSGRDGSRRDPDGQVVGNDAGRSNRGGTVPPQSPRSRAQVSRRAVCCWPWRLPGRWRCSHRRVWRWSYKTTPRCRLHRTTRIPIRARSSRASTSCATSLAAVGSSSTISTGRSTSSTSRRRPVTTYLDFNGRGGRPGLFPKFTFELKFATGLTNFIFDPDYAKNGDVLHAPHGGSGN